jgi:alkanesulfonate monooxygenase SsuD/methylene tetrahydromethanopterin reductase-like flavin-dependent oxidoreductase (luciferase family)
MEVGVHFVDFLPGDPATLGPTLAEAARAAEQGGATLFTLADHFFQMGNIARAEDPFPEGYTSLGFVTRDSACSTHPCCRLHRHGTPRSG